MKIPELSKVDHLHVYTKNRELATQWYKNKLGFVLEDKYSAWADNGGPLILSNQKGVIQLAVFERKQFTPSSIIAFGVDGKNFIEWKTYLENIGLLNACKDHEYSWSLYFSDLDDNGLEITSYDYEYCSLRLKN